VILGQKLTQKPPLLDGWTTRKLGLGGVGGGS
jgi:hypothetical protein